MIIKSYGKTAARKGFRPGLAQSTLLACGALGSAILTTSALAQESARPAPDAVQMAESQSQVDLSIAAQSLSDAALAFSEQSGLQVVFDAEAFAGIRTNAVSGRMTGTAGLKEMLAGTGVTFAVIGDTVTLQPPRKSTSTDAQQTGPVVVSATRTATPASELTRSVTVLDRDTIDKQKRIDRSVGEILGKNVPGFSPSTEALTDFGQTLRGRTFLTLIDGVPQSTPLRDGRRSLNSIDADAIEQIEVVRGSTAAYGFGATGGLVNIITRRPEDGEVNGRSEAGFKLSSTHPNDSLEWHTNHRVSGRVENYDYLLSGTFVDRDGFFDADGDRIPADPFGVQGGLADTEEFDILAKGGYETDDGERRVELTLNHFSIDQDSEFAGIGNGDASERKKTPAVRGNINVEDPGTENSTVNLEFNDADVMGSELSLQAYYGDLRTRFAKFPGFEQVQVESEKLGGRATVDTPVQLQGMPFDLTWGLDYLHDETSQPSLDAADTTPAMEQDAFAGFVQAEVPIGDVALLRGGVRHERITVDVADVFNRQNVFVNGGELDFDETLFNLSGSLYVTDEAEIFGGFSQGFSLADIGRAIADTTLTNASELQSEAQKVDNYELGVRGDYGSWNASLTGFYSESDNGTTFNQALEIAKTPERIYGVEFALDVQPTDRVHLGGTASWLEGEVDLDGDGSYEEDLPSTRIPPMKLTAYVEYLPFDWWTTRFQGLYSGNRDPNSSQFGNGEVKDYVVFDLYSSFDTGYGDLAVGVENIFNADYFPVLSQAGALDFAYSKAPGRTVSLTYSVEW